MYCFVIFLHLFRCMNILTKPSQQPQKLSLVCHINMIICMIVHSLLIENNRNVDNWCFRNLAIVITVSLFYAIFLLRTIKNLIYLSECQS